MKQKILNTKIRRKHEATPLKKKPSTQIPQNHLPPPSPLPKTIHLPRPPPPQNHQTAPPTYTNHARARRVADLGAFAGSSWTLNDAGGATAPGHPPKSSQEPLNKGPFPLQNGRSAKPTVRHLSFSLSKSPEGTLRQRKTMQKALKGTSNTLPFPSVQTQNSPKKKKINLTQFHHHQIKKK